MAQWSHVDRTLYAKIVYYGPALGGKTTNLRELHRITDPHGANRLLSLATADDRTLFFDLLPFELGSILGYRVAIKLYTVPGQVRYAATRRVVLSGADAVVFVADSSAAREADNRRSFDDLRQNLRANRLDPARVPVLVQLNKRDVPGAVPESTMASWFAGARGVPQPAVAVDGTGVLETLVAAGKAMLERLVALADTRTRQDLNRADLSRQVDEAFAVLAARSAATGRGGGGSAGGVDGRVLDGDDVLASAVEASVDLGNDLASLRAHAARLEAEACAMRRLSDAVRATGSSFDRSAIVDGALRAARDVLGAPCVSLLTLGEAGRITCEASWGRGEDPFLSCEAGLDRAGELFARHVDGAIGPFPTGSVGPSDGPAFHGLSAFAAAPVEGEPPRRIVAWAAEPGGTFDDADLRFLATLAGHLAVGLDKARLYGELAGSRERLEALVGARTVALRRAYDELESLEKTKDRFLSNLSHEMRTPLTAIVSSAAFLASYDGSREERREMVDGILHAGRALDRLLDGLFRIASLERRGDEPEIEVTSAAEIVGQAMRLARAEGSPVEIDSRIGPIGADRDRLARALANLIDNAAKFAPARSPVEVRVSACSLRRGAQQVAAAAFAVLDRGPGVPDGDLERFFAPFEQGGEIMTGKPSGVGLGLYEARLIARRHGGMLQYGARQGGGSEFRLIVPVAVVAVPVGAGEGGGMLR